MAKSSDSGDNDILELKYLQLDVQTLQKQCAANMQEFTEFVTPVKKKFSML